MSRIGSGRILLTFWKELDSLHPSWLGEAFRGNQLYLFVVHGVAMVLAVGGLLLCHDSAFMCLRKFLLASQTAVHFPPFFLPPLVISSNLVPVFRLLGLGIEEAVTDRQCFQVEVWSQRFQMLTPN